MLPKPLAVSAARRVVETDLRAGENRAPWILARDAAVLALLYGSGLRISEALGLALEDFPASGRTDFITVTGKGSKTRMVPILAQVTKLVADYVALCPYELAPGGRLFVGANGGPSRLASFSSPWLRVLVRSGFRTAPRPMRSVIPLPRICLRAAETYVRSRSCWDALPSLDDAGLHGSRHRAVARSLPQHAPAGPTAAARATRDSGGIGARRPSR